MPRSLKPIDDGPMHNAWLDALRKRIPGFKNEDWKVQYHLAVLIDKSDRTRHRHHNDPEGFSIPHQEFTERFGRQAFPAINVRLKIFETSGKYLFGSAGSETKSYRLSPLAQKAKDDFLNITGLPKKTSALYRHTGIKILKPDRAISSRTKGGGNIKNSLDGMPSALVPVNAQNLLDYAKKIDQEIDKRSAEAYQLEMFSGLPDIDKMILHRDLARKIVQWSRIDISKNNALIHKYWESNEGRLYAQDNINLQTAPSNIRKAALQGSWDYDMDNCHYSLFHQLANRAGYQADNINDYLTNKEPIRDEISKAVGRPVKAIKQCLLAMMYGTNQTSYISPNHKPPALPKYLGVNAAEKFINHPRVKGLNDDIKLGRKAIIEDHQPSKMGYIKNLIGKNIKSTEPSNKIMAHLLQGSEAKILEMARLMYPGRILLLQHDGFTCAKPINITLLEDAIEDRLGLSMTFSKVKLQIPPNWLPEESPDANHETGYSFLKSILYDDIPDLSAS
jgi:hypothetical protein